MEEKIVFIDDDGNEVEMFVIEETRINNVKINDGILFNTSTILIIISSTIPPV